MNTGPETFGNGSAKTEDRFAGPLSSYRSGRRDGDAATDELTPRNGSAIDRMAIPLSDPTLQDLGTLSEPMFGRDSWLDAPSGSLADHPLLRGLLLELPPKGTIPQQDWLDRWFEAARSILELLYSQEARS